MFKRMRGDQQGTEEDQHRAWQVIGLTLDTVGHVFSCIEFLQGYKEAAESNVISRAVEQIKRC